MATSIEDFTEQILKIKNSPRMYHLLCKIWPCRNPKLGSVKLTRAGHFIGSAVIEKFP
jgi:hypothetical protein